MLLKLNKKYLVIIFCYLLFFIFVPPFQVPDEPEHFENIYWVSRGTYPYNITATNQKAKFFVDTMIADFQTWQVAKTKAKINLNQVNKSRLWKINEFPEKEIKQFSQVSSQAYHPPIYYLVGAVFFKISSWLGLNLVLRFYFTRLVSALFYFLTLFFAYKILKKIFSDERTAKNLLVFFAINPIMLQMGVGINHDISLVCLSIMTLWFLLENKYLWAFVSASLAMMVKMSGIVNYLVIFLWMIEKKAFKISKKLFWYLLTSTLIISPWFIFNYIRYHKPIVEVVSLVCPKAAPITNPLKVVVLTLFEYRHAIMHYSGFLGWNHLNPGRIFFYSYTIIFSLLLFYGIIGSFKEKKILRLFLFNLISFCLFFFIFNGWEKVSGLGCDIQGRYLLPAFLSMTIYIFYGLKKILKNNLLASKVLLYWSIFHVVYIFYFVLLRGYYF